MRQLFSPAWDLQKCPGASMSQQVAWAHVVINDDKPSHLLSIRKPSVELTLCTGRRWDRYYQPILQMRLGDAQ